MPENPIYKIKAELMNTELKIWHEFEEQLNVLACSPNRFTLTKKWLKHHV